MGVSGLRPNARDAQQYQSLAWLVGWSCFPHRLGKGSLPVPDLPGRGGSGARDSGGSSRSRDGRKEGLLRAHLANWQ